MISYEKDLVIRQTYCNGFARSKPVKYIVVHGTGGGSSAQRLLKWMRKPGQAQQDRYKRGIALFHYLIGREGEIIEIIDPSSSTPGPPESTIARAHLVWWRGTWQTP